MKMNLITKLRVKIMKREIAECKDIIECQQHELNRLRKQVADRNNQLDKAIDRLHRAAKRMEEQAEEEKERALIICKMHGPADI